MNQALDLVDHALDLLERDGFIAPGLAALFQSRRRGTGRTREEAFVSIKSYLQYAIQREEEDLATFRNALEACD